MKHSVSKRVAAGGLALVLTCSLFAGIPAGTVNAQQAATEEAGITPTAGGISIYGEGENASTETTETNVTSETDVTTDSNTTTENTEAGTTTETAESNPSEEPTNPITLTKITAEKTVTNYTVGTNITWEDLKVTAVYSNDATKTLSLTTETSTDGYTITDADKIDNTVAGSYTVTVAYQGKTAEIVIVLEEEVITLSNLTVEKKQTTYSTYEDPTWDDVTVTATYSNGATKQLSIQSASNPNGYTMDTSAYDKNKFGQQTFTVSYTEDDKTVEAALTLTVQNELSKITAKKTNKTYTVNDELNIDDLTVTAWYNNNTSSRKLTADEYTTNADTLKLAPSGTKKLEIQYTEKNVATEADQITKTCNVSIKVNVPEVPVIDGVRTANVLDFGADPTDIYTDKDAIQDALDVSTADGVPLVVYLPAGTYYIGGPLYIHSNTTIRMADGATLTRNSYIKAGDGRDGVNHNMLKAANSGKTTDTKGGYDNVQNIVIEGGTWDGGEISKATTTSNVINIGHAENVIVRNTTIKNCYGSHLIEFAGVKNAEVYGCTFTGFRKETNGVESEAIQIDICYSDWNSAYLADKTACNGINIHDNTFTDYPVSVGNHHTVDGYHNTNVTIKDNTIRHSTGGYQGIYLYGCDNSTVTGNTISGFENGIKTNQSTSYTLDQNTISNCNFGIVSAGSSTGKITSNTISNTVYQGIFAYDATKITSISKNTLTKTGCGATRDAIAACGSSTQVDSITNNTINTTLRYGIYVYSGAKATKINSNTISNTKSSGIYVYEAGSKSTVKSNKLTSVGSTAIKINSKSYIKQSYTFAPKVKSLKLKKGTLSITATNLKKVQLKFKKKSYSKSTSKKKYTLKFKAYKKKVTSAQVLFTDKNKNVITKTVTVK